MRAREHSGPSDHSISGMPLFFVFYQHGTVGGTDIPIEHLLETTSVRAGVKISI